MSCRGVGGKRFASERIVGQVEHEIVATIVLLPDSVTAVGALNDVFPVDRTVAGHGCSRRATASSWGGAAPAGGQSGSRPSERHRILWASSAQPAHARPIFVRG